jgi:stalled ribosome rescue protein Dom34
MTNNPRHPIQFGIYSATNISSKFAVDYLYKQEKFQEFLQNIRDKENSGILQLFEKRINKGSDDSEEIPDLLVGLPEIESFIYNLQSPNQIQPEYILITETYLKKSPFKNRVHRLIQIAENRRIKTRIVSTESTAFDRVQQFGGIICFTESLQSYHIRNQGKNSN